MEKLNDIDSKLSTFGDPGKGGSCWTSFLEHPTLPTDAATKMGTLTGWESLGELSENGYTESKSITTNKAKGWHGSVILSSISEEEHTFKVEFCEPNRPSVAKMRYGVDNVETGADGGVSHIKGVVGSGVSVPLVFDELESGGFLRRTVVRRATIDSFDDTPHNKGALVVYGMTFTALAEDGENMFDIYRAKPASTPDSPAPSETAPKAPGK